VPLIATRQPPMVLGSAASCYRWPCRWRCSIEAQARHLRDDRERLARIESWRSAMMSTLAHDVRSPLTTVRLALEEMTGHVSGPREWMLASALRQTARIARLADGLLDVQRIDSSGQLSLDRHTVAARPLLEQALSYVRTAEVTAEVGEEQTQYVEELRFEQIVVNLVGNALRYGRPPVVVRITRDGGMDLERCNGSCALVQCEPG
jgi:signal transduction histidine kinase